MNPNEKRTILFATLLVAGCAARGQDAALTLPDPVLTPGAVRTTSLADVCNDPHTRQYRHWSREKDNAILREYGLPPGPHPTYEIDHLIPLDIGGADSNNNLWPEPRANIVEWKFSAEAKDRLEWRMHDMVCAGEIEITQAQREIASDWRKAYEKYFH